MSTIIKPSSNKYHWLAAKPFPHLVVDDLVDWETLERVLSTWPRPDWCQWRGFANQKFAVMRPVCLTDEARQLCESLNSQAFLSHLGWLTGIPKLLADSQLTGGGMHETREGGKLGMHLDFNRKPDRRSTAADGRGLYRRLNLLVYLNEERTQASGGWLQLSAGTGSKGKTEGSVLVPPTMGTQVLMSVQDGGWHGHPTSLVGPVPRRSIAMYYYTDELPVATEYTVHRHTTNYKF